jgi:hypothetical protein
MKLGHGVMTYKNEQEGDTYLGQVGDLESSRIDAMRIGNDVVINGMMGTNIIPDSTIAKGFGRNKDGKTLRELMSNERLYNYRLDPMPTHRYALV